MTVIGYHYGGKAKDGEGKEFDIPPRDVLKQFGALLHPVTITHPEISSEALEQESREVPAVTVNALIDTGASVTVITPEVADKLSLVHTGYQNIQSVQDSQKQPVFFGRIIFQWGGAIDIPIVSCPLAGHHFACLIGRDILNFWHLTYNGVEGSITICD